MDKIKRLVTKYGLSEEYAGFIKDKINFYELIVNHGKEIVKQENEKNTVIIKKAGRNVEEVDLNNMSAIDFKNQISLIEFTLMDKKYAIDDPWVIRSIQHFIARTGFVFADKMKRGKQPNPPFLKELAIDLMEKAPQGTDYSKRVWVGSIFAEFLQE
jgi:hypothetical protein